MQCALALRMRALFATVPGRTTHSSHLMQLHFKFDRFRPDFRTATSMHRPTKRYTLPDRPLVTAIVGYNDRNMLNQCLMYRYIPSFEPENFHGSLDLFPDTMRYGPSRISCVLTHTLRARPRSHCRAPLRLPLPPSHCNATTSHCLFNTPHAVAGHGQRFAGAWT